MNRLPHVWLGACKNSLSEVPVAGSSLAEVESDHQGDRPGYRAQKPKTGAKVEISEAVLPLRARLVQPQRAGATPPVRQRIRSTGSTAQDVTPRKNGSLSLAGIAVFPSHRVHLNLH